MIDIVTPAEMALIDANAEESIETLIDRAGAAVARRAFRLLGGAYGRRVVVIAGKGNNGADGVVAAERLRRRGVVVDVVAPAEQATVRLDRADLVIDAAYGTGFHSDGGSRPGASPWRPLEPAGVPVLAVDIPSGVSGLTGEGVAGVPRAVETVTFAALKPGLLLDPGRTLAGPIHLADVGLDTSTAMAWLVEDEDLRRWLPPRPIDSHKWQRACWVIAGSVHMPGAAVLAARGALRAGAGLVRSSTPGVAEPIGASAEVVTSSLPDRGWAAEVLGLSGRFGSLVIGPGLGRTEATDHEVCHLVSSAPQPLVVDADGLTALVGRLDRTTAQRSVPAVLTPHDGEYERLMGRRPGPDRFAAARSLAGAAGAVVLLKGPTTMISSPDGRCYAVTSGTPDLATAGSGDVLAGVIGAFLAAGTPPFEAAAVGAHVHGRAGALLGIGLVAGDLPDVLPKLLDELLTDATPS